MSQMVTNLVEQCISVSHKTSIKKIFNILLSNYNILQFMPNNVSKSASHKCDIICINWF